VGLATFAGLISDRFFSGGTRHHFLFSDRRGATGGARVVTLAVLVKQEVCGDPLGRAAFYTPVWCDCWCGRSPSWLYLRGTVL